MLSLLGRADCGPCPTQPMLGCRPCPRAFFPWRFLIAPSYEKDCVTRWRDRRQLSWAHRWHSPWRRQALLGQSTHSIPSITDSQDGWDLTVLPCSLSCSHLSQMLQGLTHLSGRHPSSLSWNLSMKPSLTLPLPGKADEYSPGLQLDILQPLIVACHTVMSFFHLLLG